MVSREIPRVVFLGTPAFAVPSLEALEGCEHVDVVGVITQPDRPSGRGRRVQPPPVKVIADRLAVPVHQTATLRDRETRAWLDQCRADLYVVAAFGLILGRRMLEQPRFGALNVHASLLPRYRGASPVAAAIALGERITGVSLMRMDAGLDTGPVYARREIAIRPDDTTGTLTSRLAEVGAALLVDTLPSIIDGTLPAVPQTGHATLTRPLRKEDGRIDWHRPATALLDHIRAMLPWPRAFTTLPSGALLQIHEARVSDVPISRTQLAGSVVVAGSRLAVVCGQGGLEILSAQPAGSAVRSAEQLLQGRIINPGDRLGVNDVTMRVPPLVVHVEPSVTE